MEDIEGNRSLPNKNYSVVLYALINYPEVYCSTPEGYTVEKCPSVTREF
jgi:hypothetical protein